MSTATFLIVLWEILGSITKTLLRFSLFVAVTYFLIYVVFKRFFARRKIQERPFNWKAFRHDAVFAAFNLSANILIGLGLAWLIRHGYVTVLKGPVAWYLVAAHFLLYFLVFDAYFYWIHRWFHTPWLYKKVHKFHHRSTSPTPLTAFAFHPIEGMVFNGFVPLMMLFVDLHIASIAMIYGYGILNSLLIHSGHEVFPRNWYRNPLTAWYLTPTHHDYHHAKFQYNFGGFMTLWDRWMKTEQPHFLEAYDAVKAKLDEPPPEAADEPQEAATALSAE